MIMLQFGEKLPGKTYIRRPGGYGVVFDADRRILVILERGKYFLPGGGIESGESAEKALIREMYEEAGMTIRIVGKLGNAAEYIYAPSQNAYYNKIGTFYLAEIAYGHGPENADGHDNAVWVTIDTFETMAAHESHVWAVRRAITDSSQSPGPAHS